MGELTRIDDGTVVTILQHSFPRHDDPGEVRHRSTTHQRATRSIGHTQPAFEPVHHHQLHLARTGTLDPGAPVDVVARGECITHRAHERTGARDEAEHARMIDVRHAWSDFLLELPDDLVELLTLFRRRLSQH